MAPDYLEVAYSYKPGSKDTCTAHHIPVPGIRPGELLVLQAVAYHKHRTSYKVRVHTMIPGIRHVNPNRLRGYDSDALYIQALVNYSHRHTSYSPVVGRPSYCTLTLTVCEDTIGMPWTNLCRALTSIYAAFPRC